MKTLKLTTLILLSTFVASAGFAQVASYSLVAHQSTKTMQDGAVVNMWGYYDATGAAPASWTTGPELHVPATASTLEVTLTNNLSEPTSLFIPGLAPEVIAGVAGEPVYSTSGSGIGRVHSFTHETAPGATETYRWHNVTPGTYLYQSGTNPSKQLQMGLYGAMYHDANDVNPGTGSAVDGAEIYPGHTYHQQVALLFSEVDPVINAAISADDYGFGNTVTSSIGRTPKYYLINGEEYDPLNPTAIGTEAGPLVLLRFLNAGYQTYVPVIQDLYMNIIGDDGNELPHPRVQYSIEVPAGKTHDAIVAIPCELADRNVVLHDRRGHIRNQIADDPGTTSVVETEEADGGMTVTFQIPIDTACDNCADLSNPTQTDVDADGFGNLCDADLSGDLMTNFGDLGLFIDAFVNQSNPAADFNSDGVVNFGDLGVMATGFGSPPGPSLAVY